MIAGLAYELIRFAGKHPDNRVLMTLLAPGLWLQRLTTRQPTLDQLEVSISALREVLELEERGRRPADRVEVMAVDGNGSSALRVDLEGQRSMEGSGTIADVDERRDRRARRHVGRALGGRDRRQDEPRGADRRRARRVLLDGALARPREGGHAAGASSKTSATVTFQPGEGITKIALTVEGSVPGLDADAFEEAAQAAKENCPVSKALAGVPEITLDAGSLS